MIEEKSVHEQAHEVQNLVPKIVAKGIPIDERLQVPALIDKFPPSWNDFKVNLKHRRVALTMDDLMSSIQIEEKHRNKNKKLMASTSNEIDPNANVVQSKKFNLKRKKFKKGEASNTNRDAPRKKQKSDKTCYVCGKAGHFARNCSYKKGSKEEKDVPKPQANVVTTGSGEAGPSSTRLVITNSEINFASSSSLDWYIDTGANVHVCYNVSSFSSYQRMKEKVVVMGNSSNARVHGVGRVNLKFTSGNSITLQDVHHVPEIRKNLISGSLLNLQGFKLMFESSKVVISKNNVFVGIGYVCDCLFKLNIMECVVSNSCNSRSYVYHVSDCDVWHGRLGHVNYNTINRMIRFNLIPYYDTSSITRCDICVQSKKPRKPFPQSHSETSLLELIHSDICEMDGVLTHSGKRYFITFIDDY